MQRTQSPIIKTSILIKLHLCGLIQFAPNKTNTHNSFVADEHPSAVVR